jgi:DinB family protein
MAVSSRWFDRTFAFDMPVALAPNVVERLRGTPARLEELTRGATRERLTRRVDSKWSAQEHAGHLLDLEPLGLTRLEEFVANRPRLTAADLENRRTDEAGHNTSDIAVTLRGFRAERMAFVARLDAADETLWERRSLHPRLGTPMRLLDLALFIAEHDDHHLAAIRRLLA